MNFNEVKSLGNWCAAAFPQQKWNDNTPTVWAELLEPYSYEDGKAAAKALVGRQAFIALSDLLTEIKRIRKERILAVGPEALGAGVPGDDVAGYLEKVRADVKAIGDGASPAEIEAGTARPVGALVAGLANRRSIEGKVS